MAATPGREGAVAPQERVNIRYKTDTGGAVEEVELPLRLLVVGDFTARDEATEVEERQPVNVDGNNFDEVLRAQRVELSMQVDNVLHPAEAELSVNLRFNALKDFEPEAVARQIPELCALLELREALTELKGPLSQNTEFRRHLQRLLDDGSARHRVRGELGLGTADQSEDA